MAGPPAAAAPRPPRIDGAGRHVLVDPGGDAVHGRLLGPGDLDLDPEFPDLEDLVLHGATVVLPGARTVSIRRCHLLDCRLEGADDAEVEMIDSIAFGLDLTGRRMTQLARCQLTRCRLGGADLTEATVRDLTLDDCVLDLSAWRLATIERLEVRGGRAEEVDWTAVTASDVVLADLAPDLSLHGARLTRVDLTAADLGRITDVVPLAGCTLGPAQAIALLPQLARAAGIHLA